MLTDAVVPMDVDLGGNTLHDRTNVNFFIGFETRLGGRGFLPVHGRRWRFTKVRANSLVMVTLFQAYLRPASVCPSYLIVLEADSIFCVGVSF